MAKEGLVESKAFYSLRIKERFSLCAEGEYPKEICRCEPSVDAPRASGVGKPIKPIKHGE